MKPLAASHLAGRFRYLICLIASFTFATMFSGSGAYVSVVVIFWPSVTIQLRKSARILPFAASFDCCGINNQVKLQMGYASFPGALVMDTRKSAGIFGADPAAAVTPSSEAFKNVPAELRTLPYGILFCTA